MDQPNNLKKVLIVDDEDMTRVLLTHILQRMRVDGLEVILAEDGEEAVQDGERHASGTYLVGCAAAENEWLRCLPACAANCGL